MRRSLLVISPVHPPDDPRIRHKLIRTLQDDWDVTFAGIGRGPIDQEGIRWRELRGGRIARWLRSSWLLLRSKAAVISVHDPEMLPAAIIAGLMGRTVVFDVHENVPDQLRTKPWLPGPLRRPVAALAAWLLRLAEKRLVITLAEAGYTDLFAGSHPVFPNYLAGDPPPPREFDPSTGVVYLGDVTEARGLRLAVTAAAAAGVAVMTIMGRCQQQFRDELTALARSDGMTIEFRGFVSPDEALRTTAGALLGLSPLLDTPNYRRSLPTKVLEYLAVGVPTLASDLPGTRSVVADKPGVVLVPPGDFTAWRDAIATAIVNEDLRVEAASGARAVRGEFVWPADEVRRFYADLVAG